MNRSAVSRNPARGLGRRSLVRPVLLAGAVVGFAILAGGMVGIVCAAAEVAPVSVPDGEGGREGCGEEAGDRLDRPWAVSFGVAAISDNVPSDYLHGAFRRLEGPGGGLTYNLTVSRRVYRWDGSVWGWRIRPELEVPARLTLVDENTGRVVPDLNLGVALRWRDFPWGRWVATSVAAGPGLSYSFQPWTADVQRHEASDGDRSRLKFWLPMELTLAWARYPHRQLVAFIDHQSGGALFDRGGVDAWGLGLRMEF